MSNLPRLTTSNGSCKRKEFGFTLLELLTVIAILAILIALLLPVVDQVREKANGARCMNSMRSLVASFHSYLNDHQAIWPQPPATAKTLQDEQPFWLETMKPYGGGDIKAWQCPSLIHRQGDTPEVKENIHYAPALFDGNPGTATKWPKMPWVIELGAYHSFGSLAAFQDGSVRPLIEKGKK